MNGFITDPSRIEQKSMKIISEILGDSEREYDELSLAVVKRVIHTTADFEFAHLLTFKGSPIQAIMAGLEEGLNVVTDTMMAYAGMNKAALRRFGSEVECYISDEEVADIAKSRGITRAMASMEKASKNRRNAVYVIGNAPTALVRVLELCTEGAVAPKAIVGVPVGFVGAAESKELLGKSDIPTILTRGRKGGSNVAAAIMNAILYMMGG